MVRQVFGPFVIIVAMLSVMDIIPELTHNQFTEFNSFNSHQLFISNQSLSATDHHQLIPIHLKAFKKPHFNQQK